MSQLSHHPSLLGLGGISGIVAGIFLPGVLLQIPVTGWFPEDALQQGTLSTWLPQIAQQQPLVLLGIGCSILAILAFLPFGFALYQLFPKKGWLSTAAMAGYGLGVPLALVAFTFAFGFSWALIDLYIAGETAADLSALATMGMRGFLAGDDLATCLIGLSNGLMALAALKQGLLPKWLCWWGMIAGGLVTIVLFRFFIPLLAIAQIGYPMVILWFVLTGVQLLRKKGTLRP